MRSKHWVLLFILSIVTAPLLYLYFSGGFLLATLLSSQMKVPVGITALQLTPRNLAINGTVIVNPDPIHDPRFALRLGRLSIDAPFWAYFQQDIHIEEISLHKLYLSIVYTDPENTVGNWSIIHHNMVGDNPPASKSQTTGTIYVDRLVFYGLQVVVQKYGEEPLELPPVDHPIVIENLSTERGIPAEQISEIIIEEIMNELGPLYGLQSMFSAPVKLFSD